MSEFKLYLFAVQAWLGKPLHQKVHYYLWHMGLFATLVSLLVCLLKIGPHGVKINKNYYIDDFKNI